MQHNEQKPNLMYVPIRPNLANKPDGSEHALKYLFVVFINELFIDIPNIDYQFVLQCVGIKFKGFLETLKL